MHQSNIYVVISITAISTLTYGPESQWTKNLKHISVHIQSKGKPACVYDKRMRGCIIRKRLSNKRSSITLIIIFYPQTGDGNKLCEVFITNDVMFLCPPFNHVALCRECIVSLLLIPGYYTADNEGASVRLVRGSQPCKYHWEYPIITWILDATSSPLQQQKRLILQ